MTNEELEQFGKLLDARFEAEREHTRKMVREENEPMEKRLDGLEQGQAHTNTVVGKIKTVVEITEETVNTMDEGLKEVVKDHRERIKRLEEQASTTSHKN